MHVLVVLMPCDLELDTNLVLFNSLEIMMEQVQMCFFNTLWECFAGKMVMYIQQTLTITRYCFIYQTLCLRTMIIVVCSLKQYLQYWVRYSYMQLIGAVTSCSCQVPNKKLYNSQSACDNSMPTFKYMMPFIYNDLQSM